MPNTVNPTNNHLNPSYYQKWFDKECALKRAQLGEVRQQSKRDESITGCYLQLDKEYKSLCRKKRRNYELKISHEMEQELFKNANSFWTTYKKLNTKKKDNIPWSAIDSAGEVHHGVKATLKVWGDMYQSLTQEKDDHPNCKGTEFRNSLLDEIQNQDKQQSQTLQEKEMYLLTRNCNLKELKSLIQTLKNKKAPGMDGIRPELIKHLPDSFLLTLVTFFNILIEHELTPSEWGCGEIKPIHKSDDQRFPLNYRPITLLSIIGKLFSSLINRRLYIWAEKHGILSEEQGGFRKSRSCDDHALTLAELIKMRIGKKKSTYTCFVDFRKAFDSVYRKGLWVRLWRSGIKDKIYKTLRAIYDETSATLNINGQKTKNFSCDIGIRQGCPLSPLLFAIFINQLIDDLKALKVGISISTENQTKQLASLFFADDLVLLAESAEDLQILISETYKYCCNWKMAINVKKTKVVIFNQQEEEDDCFALDQEIPDTTKIQIVDRYKYLGVIFRNDLSWDTMVQYVTDSSRRKVFALMTFCLKHDLRSAALLEFLFRTTIRPSLEYGVSLWGFQEYPKLEAVQLMFGKFILGVTKSTASVAVRGELGWFTLHSRRKELILRNYYRVMKLDQSRILKQIIQLSNSPNRRPSWLKKSKKLLSTITETFPKTQNIPNRLEEEFLNLKPTTVKLWVRQKIQTIERNDWLDQVKSMSSLSTYSQIKHELKFEHYLRTPHLTAIQRTRITKMRTGDNHLRICTGRKKYQYEEREERICVLCDTGQIESEHHSILECQFYNNERTYLLSKIDVIIPDIKKLIPEKILRIILLDDTILCKEQILKICPITHRYLEKSKKKREEKLTQLTKDKQNLNTILKE
eukprot:Lithocolla_globosa_v1_NODE_177_length_5446_cov_18.556483.p1 type:complete len:863 gc:universal NODE_177_length_5446_cov_18.556483:2622-34(-)